MRTLVPVAAALAVTLSATAAYAQAARPAAPAAAPAARPANPGPVIAGICVLDEQRAVLTSAAGRAFTTRMQQLSQQVQAELQGQQTPLETEARRIGALPDAQRAAPSQALNPRIQTFQRLASQRQAELEATQQQQLRRIANEMQPVVSQVYSQRGCGVMLDGQSIVYANPAMNVTDAVITALNARLPTLTFNRATVPATPATTPATRP